MSSFTVVGGPDRNGTEQAVIDHAYEPDHVHAWPRDRGAWNRIRACQTCGTLLLRQFVNSSSWVVRRVERIAFIDDRTVRRRVSVDYLAPNPAVALQVGRDSRVRVLPLAIMRKKSLVNFDLIRHDEQPISLVGLRENQALTGAIVRAAALAALSANDAAAGLQDSVEDFLEAVASGDQTDLNEAYRSLHRAGHSDQLGQLRQDRWFRAVMDRLADSFILLGLDSARCTSRQIIKFAYDEPLTMRYREAGYKRLTELPNAAPHRSSAVDEDRAGSVSEERVPVYLEGEFLSPWRKAPLLARLGLTPTLIRFPVSAAELAASFHFEVEAPPEVSIVRGELIAGRPNAVPPEAGSSQENPRPNAHRTKRNEAEWIPSFDAVIGGYPTIDLHVADVPYGSLGRAQVALQATPKGWLSTAVLACLVSSATLAIAWAAHHARADVGSTLMVTFAAALVAVLARPDPHRMITRLLSSIRLLAGTSALITFAGALAFAFIPTSAAHVVLGTLALISLVPTALALLAWLTAIARLNVKPRRSPWEQRRPVDEREPVVEPDVRDHIETRDLCRGAELPYDVALKRLRFDQPAIKVASSEGCRRRFELDSRLLEQVDRRSAAHLHRMRD